MALRLIVGLGNPGSRYEGTRHNFGFMTVDRLVDAQAGTFRHTRFGEVAEIGRLAVLKPQTFMNLSGEAVGPFCRFYRLSPADIMVVADDLDLPLGALRIRRGGSSGGHNGLKSIAAALGTEEFPRMRLGISRPPAPLPVIDWVLGRPAGGDKGVAAEVMDRALQALICLRDEGIDMAMSRYNG